MQYEWKNMENDDHPSVLLRHLLKFLKFSKATAASHPPELLYPLGFGYHTSTPVTTKKKPGTSCRSLSHNVEGSKSRDFFPILQQSHI